MLLCDRIGCPIERLAQSICDELDGKNGRAKCNAAIEHVSHCAMCNERAEWKRDSEGLVRWLGERRASRVA